MTFENIINLYAPKARLLWTHLEVHEFWAIVPAIGLSGRIQALTYTPCGELQFLVEAEFSTPEEAIAIARKAVSKWNSELLAGE